MKFYEKTLEDIIFESDSDILSDKGLIMPIHRYKTRQLRIGNYGIADIVYWYSTNTHFYVSVFELKRGKIGIDTFLQGMKYCSGIKSHVNEKSNLTLDINLFLIGDEINKKSDFILLPPLLDTSNFSLELYTYKYTVDGIVFKDHNNYVLSDENLSEGIFYNSNKLECSIG